MKRLLTCAGFLCSLWQPLQAVWYSEGVPENADTIMMDVRWPYWPGNTYFALWNGTILPDRTVTYYGGYAPYCKPEPDNTPCKDEAIQKAYHPEWVWTFWGGNTSAEPPEFIDTFEDLHADNASGGEGAACYTPNRTSRLPNVNTWNTQVMKCWTDPSDGRGRVARFMREEGGEWIVIGVARLSVPATGFNGNAGFIETVGCPPMPRTLDRKNGYARIYGSKEWVKTGPLSHIANGWTCFETFSEPAGDYASILYAGDPVHLPWGKFKTAPFESDPDKTHAISLTAPDVPPATAGAFAGPARAAIHAHGADAVLTWQENRSEAPLFRTTIGGKELNLVRSARAGAVRLPKGTRLPADVVFEDIFGRTKTVRIGATAPETVPTRASAAPGIAFTLTDGQGAGITRGFLADLDGVTQLLALPDIKLRAAKGYTLNCRARLNVPATGLYILRFRSDGGFALRLGGKDLFGAPVAAMHGSTVNERAVMLKAGAIDFDLMLSKDETIKRGTIRDLRWEGPAFSMQTFTASNFNQGAQPVNPGAEVAETRLNLNGLKLAETPTYNDLLPYGTNTMTKVTRFTDGSIRISAPLSVVGGKPQSTFANGWSHSILASDDVVYGIRQDGPDAFSFIGQGMHLVSKRVTGDYTATLKIESQSDDGDAFEYKTWTGIGAFPAKRGRDWHWSPAWYVFHRPWLSETRMTPFDHTDLGGTRMSKLILENGPWYRITRKGQELKAWTSQDGVAWRLGATCTDLATDAEQDVGLFIHAVSGHRTSEQYRSSVSHLSVQEGVSE